MMRAACTGMAVSIWQTSVHDGKCFTMVRGEMRGLILWKPLLSPGRAKRQERSRQMEKIYVAEFNRACGDSIRTCARRLAAWGLDVDILPHPTTLRTGRPPSMSWETFKEALRSVIQPIRGAVLLFSKTTGKVFVCSNAGNMPGRFRLIE
jgi:hypothetical protein